MNQTTTCITIDVSQGKSHIQGFISLERPLGKAKRMRHTKQGYEQIITLINIIKSKTATIPLVVLEYTGIYHKSLEKFLVGRGIIYHLVAPLRAAKARNSEIRNQKTDARDCLSLAKMFYSNNLGEFVSENKDYAKLRKLNRIYENNLNHIIKIKVNFREALAILYPNYDDLFLNVYSDVSLTFLKNFPHSDKFLNKSKKQIINILLKEWNHLEDWTINKIAEIYPFVIENVSGCDEDDPDVQMLISYIEQLEYYIHQNDEILKNMIKLAKNTTLYPLIYSLPGVKDNLTARLIAELGDINRFNNYKSIVAYGGIDPMIRQSGDYEGLHLRISRKGNRRFRSLLYLIVNSMIKSNRAPSAIRDYYQKKTQQVNPLKPKAASIACANKLVRIIYYMHKTGSLYTYKE